jgi:hypothetical protein
LIVMLFDASSTLTNSPLTVWLFELLALSLGIGAAAGGCAGSGRAEGVEGDDGVDGCDGGCGSCAAT